MSLFPKEDWPLLKSFRDCWAPDPFNEFPDRSLNASREIGRADFTGLRGFSCVTLCHSLYTVSLFTHDCCN